ncbi:hypothetical protein QO001_003573 [Methylobacterium brachiatum]|uniref:Glycosyltransferase 61 catalytic domain-containing protein n=1 Tax=Methylobacterium brachiatum TaxID=269660 RepID=A0AAJ1TTR3_9HYPH|nr:glycosyltransferase family 61 protein [Methylobacterium brachiatum]MCB4801159.1 glycosyltransferase family 61 protein [Methylobacterium brachiatum]MDQ0544639.1 hypothetical protein [Methylobacterium brachiatum]
MRTPRYISCDPSVYAAGGFPGDADLLAGLHGSPAPEIVPVAKLYAPARYTRVLDTDAIFADPALLPALTAAFAFVGGAQAVAPGSVLVRIDKARIHDRSLTIDRDGETLQLFETFRPADRVTLPQPGPGAPTRTLPSTDAYLLLTSSGTFNWGHWLAEDLPRLLAVEHLARRHKRICLLLHGFVPATDRMRIELLRALLHRRDVTLRLLRPDTTYRAETLYFASPVAGLPGPKHPQALADLSARAIAMMDRLDRRWWRPAPRRPTRLFVIRRRDRGRVPVGWDDLCRTLLARGYQPFDPEGISAREQAAAFAGAEHVVGCMGAAMVNTLFCRPGTRILYLAPETFTDPYYLDLAAARGHRYGVCYGKALDPTRPAQSDYVLDPDHLARALAWLDGDRAIRRHAA